MKATNNDELKTQVILRLNRIEGQIRGISKMVEEERSCDDVLSQMAAVKGAMNSLSGKIVESYVRNCFVRDMNLEIPDDTLERLLDVFRRLQNQS